MTSKALARAVSLGVVALSIATAALAQQSADSYRVSVWAMVEFGHDGRAANVSIVDADQYPAAFVANVKQRLAGARVPPPEADGKPAVLKSGVELRFMVTPTAAGGTVRVDGIAIGPMPTKKYFASFPEELKRVRGWEGEVRGSCSVTPQGRCGAIDIETYPGMPESVRKYGKASLEQWQFEPQRLNGQPVAGDYSVRIWLRNNDQAPDDLRQDRFLKILRAR